MNVWGRKENREQKKKFGRKKGLWFFVLVLWRLVVYNLDRSSGWIGAPWVERNKGLAHLISGCFFLFGFFFFF